MHRALVLTVALSSVLFAACGDDADVTSGSAAAITTTTVSAPVTEPPATEPPATEPPTTEPVDTTSPFPAGWQPIDATTIAAPIALPCCASNFVGEPSPPLPAEGEPLPDGAYRLILEWPQDVSEPIAATVRRYEQCAVLPAGSCEDEGPEFQPDSLGVDMSSEYPLEVTLDDQFGVVLTGYADNSGVSKVGNGADLGELITAVDADYEAAIGSRIAAGEDSGAVFLDVAANPEHGFAEDPTNYGGLLYTHGDAPPLLFQGSVEAIFSPDARGSNIMGPISLVVADGRPTLVVYAGFYS